MFSKFTHIARSGFLAIIIVACYFISNAQTPIPGHAGKISNGTGGALLSNPNSVFVSGNYAYVASSGSNTLEIIDISNPASPVHNGSITDGTGGALLSNPVSVFVLGNYAYVASAASNALEVVNVTDRANPVHYGSLTNGTGGAILNSPSSVYVLGTNAYVVSSASNSLEIIDVTDPSAPAHLGSIVDGAGGALLNSPSSVFVLNSLAYVSSSGSNALEIIDVTDATTPLHKGSLSDGAGGALLNAPASLYISGTNAYVASTGSSAIEIVDVTDPTAPAHKSSLSNGGSVILGSPQSVYLFGNYAYVASNSGNALEIVDVTDSSLPQHQASLSNGAGGAMLASPTSVFVSGPSAFVTSSSDNALEVIALFTPLAPTTTSANSVSENSFTVNWTAVSNSTSFEIDVSADNFATLLPSYNPATTTGISLVVSGLTGCTDYQFKVRGVNANGTSTDSNVELVTTGVTTPVAAAASVISQTGFTANWNSISCATGYYLDVATDNVFGTILPSYNNLSVGGTSQSVTGLTEGTTYYYRVRSTNASGTSSNSNSISTITVPADPTATAASSITQSSFTANWNSATGATDYDLDVATDSGFGSIIGSYTNISLTSKSVTGLGAGTTYYYRVRSLNSSGTSSNSNSISTITVPADPTATAASSITQSSFTANWNSATGATDYDLDVATDSGFGSIIGSYTNISLTSKSVTGLGAGTTYYYRVRSLNSSGTSSNSNSISTITVPTDPIATAASSITQSGFIANWNSVTGATDYDLDVATDSGFGSIIGLYTNISLTSKSVTGLTSGTTYYYRVRSNNASGTSSNSNSISTITIPADPIAIAASSITQSGFIANWNSVQGATDYDLDVATDSGFGSIIGSYTNISLTSKSITGLSVSTTYYYRVRSTNASGTSSNSNAISTITVPADPTATVANYTTQSTFTAGWNSVAGAGSYDLVVATDVAFTAILSSYNNLSVNGTTQSVIGLTTGTTYYYRVRSTNVSGASSYSNIISVITIPADPIATAASSTTQNSFMANWNSVTGASGYRLDVSTNSGFTATLSLYNNLSVSGTSQIVTGLSAGTNYYYRVRSFNSSGTSSNSNTISLITIPANPTAIAASSITQNGFTANWNSVTGASGYYLDVSADAFASVLSSYNNIAVAGTSQNVIGLTAGTTYYYRVRSANTSGASSNSNTISTITVPANPTVAAASSITQISFTANWNSVLGANGYKLDVATDGSFLNILSSYTALLVSGTSQSVTGLSPATTYYYRVRSTNVGGTSLNSNVISTITVSASPTATAASSIAQSGFIANWNSVAGASGYYLDVATDASLINILSSYNNLSVSGTSQSVTGLSAGVTYYYRVRSANVSGTSATSNVTSVITIPADPTATAASTITQSTFTANWNAVAGASGYNLDVATDALFASILSSYNNLSVSGTSQSVTGLSAETNYYYRVRSKNASGASSSSNVITLQTSPAPTTEAIPTLSSGGTLQSYTMFSIPLALQNNDSTIATLFSALGAYTPDKWRLLRWNSTANNWDEYQKGISTIDRGKSYWFNSVSSVSVSVTGTPFAKSSFALQLKPGWNQIGSPYNFDVSWADVIAKNASVTGVSLVETSLYKYVSSSASFSQTDNLKAWGGGFVFNGGSAITLKIPITVTHAIGGRASSNQTIFSNTDNWFLPLKLSVNAVENNYSGIGMHTDAISSYDQFDGITVPRFVRYLELNSYHADFFEPYFARDVVATAKSYNWHLIAESNLDNENAVLTWDSHSLGNNETQLILFDPATGSIVDMKQNSQYNFKIQGKHPLHFFYAVDKESFKPDITSLASVYPNPVSTTATFPVFVANSSERVQIEIYDNLGKVVKSIGNGIYDAGLHMEQWDCTDSQGSRVSSGMYIYRFVGENNLIQTGKLIVK